MAKAKERPLKPPADFTPLHGATGPVGEPMGDVGTARRAVKADKAEDLVPDFRALTRTVRIINRGEKGTLDREDGTPGTLHRGFMACVNGELYPDGADPEDEDTWLQPGEYMDVPKDVAISIAGNCFDPVLPDRNDIIRRYGDFQYQEGPAILRNAPTVKVGPPALPDLVLQQVDGRGRLVGEPRAIWDLYLKGVTYSKLAKVEVMVPV